MFPDASQLHQDLINEALRKQERHGYLSQREREITTQNPPMAYLFFLSVLSTPSSGDQEVFNPIILVYDVLEEAMKRLGAQPPLLDYSVMKEYSRICEGVSKQEALTLESLVEKSGIPQPLLQALRTKGAAYNHHLEMGFVTYNLLFLASLRDEKAEP